MQQQHDKDVYSKEVCNRIYKSKSVGLSDTGGNSLGVLVKERAAYEVVHDQHLAPCQLALLNLIPPAQQDTNDCAGPTATMLFIQLMRMCSLY